MRTYKKTEVDTNDLASMAPHKREHSSLLLIRLLNFCVCVISQRREITKYSYTLTSVIALKPFKVTLVTYVAFLIEI
jgi:hypothetical protein